MVFENWSYTSEHRKHSTSILILQGKVDMVNLLKDDTAILQGINKSMNSTEKSFFKNHKT